MDRLIKRFTAERDEDLALCLSHGVAYQTDAGRVSYDADYLAKVESYDGAIASKVNAGRCAMLSRWLPPATRILDVGAGSGAFVHEARAAGFEAYGFEIIAEAAARLRADDIYSEDPAFAAALTLWDSIEHMAEPELWLGKVKKGAHLFASVPIFEDLRRIRESKHYRPGEHLYYWTVDGFVEWMAHYGYRFLEASTHEMDAGRESIGAFAFCRDLPGYEDYIDVYRQMHESRYYGSSATELHLGAVAQVVLERQPHSILDFGCGRSDLVAHFWRDGKRRLARYDPAIHQLRELPQEKFDLVLCCDVMEHIPMAGVDTVLAQIRELLAPRGAALFTISTKLAKARLPDGRNAHCTLLTRWEWSRWVADICGPAKEITSDWEHELILLAGKPLRQR